MDTNDSDINLETNSPIRRCCVRTGNLCSSTLRFISMGKYSSKLYHNGFSRHSSVLGGILTLAFALVFIAYSIAEVRSVFNRTNVSISEREHYAVETLTNNLTIKVADLSDLFIVKLTIWWPKDELTDRKCEDITL